MFHAVWPSVSNTAIARVRVSAVRAILSRAIRAGVYIALTTLSVSMISQCIYQVSECGQETYIRGRVAVASPVVGDQVRAC